MGRRFFGDPGILNPNIFFNPNISSANQNFTED